MKRVSDEVSNLPVESVEGEKANHANDFAERVVNKIMNELRGIHPAWRASIKSESEYATVKRNYIKAMMEQGVCSMDQVTRGLERARENKSDFFPGPGKFCAWCLDDGQAREAFLRMSLRKPAKSLLEQFVCNECAFNCRRMSEEKAFQLFEKTFNKYKKLEREGKFPAKFKLLPPKSVISEFDRLRNERGPVDPATVTGIFHRIAKLGRGEK